MATQTKMKAPKGTTSAVIEGHEYEIPESGVIKVAQEAHVPTLERHGFVEHHEEDETNVEEFIETCDDKDELVKFIEERGGEADNDMGFKKLRRLAREAVAGSQED